MSDPLSLLSKGYSKIFTRVKRLGCKSGDSPQCRAEVKMRGTIPPLLPYALMVLCLTFEFQS